MKTELPHFEGRAVKVATLALTGKAKERVGALAQDEEVYLIVRGTCSKITHGDISVNGADVYARQHTVKAEALMLIERENGERLLTEATMLADEKFGLPNLFHQGEEGEE